MADDTELEGLFEEFQQIAAAAKKARDNAVDKGQIADAARAEAERQNEALEQVRGRLIGTIRQQ